MAHKLLSTDLEAWPGNPTQVRERSLTTATQPIRSRPSDAAGSSSERPSPLSQAFGDWVKALHPDDRWVLVMLDGILPQLIQGLLAKGPTLRTGDAVDVERAIQSLLQPVGCAAVEAAWSLQGHDRRPEQTPNCPHCGRRGRLKDSAREHIITTLFGPTKLRQPYYVCPACHRGWSLGEDPWHLGPGKLSPVMTQIVADAGARLAFGEAADLLKRVLAVEVDDNTVERTTENMGLIVEARANLRVEDPAPPEHPDPGSDVLLVCADGGRVHAGGQWREAKCVAVATLGPKTVVDADTGRQRLVPGDKHYAATITDSDDFFANRVRPLAEDFGIHHPRVKQVVLLADGGAWIEQRWSTLGLSADVEVVDILDIRHLEEHLHACADAVFGQHTPPAEAWARQMSETVRANGPKPVLHAVDALVPPNPEAAEEVSRLHGYLTRNAHRLEYPSFLARKLPIGSGLVEAEVKVVVNQRAKRSGMRWTVPGAQAVLALRALVLSAPACLERFWATHPQTARLPINLLPGSGRAA